MRRFLAVALSLALFGFCILSCKGPGLSVTYKGDPISVKMQYGESLAEKLDIEIAVSQPLSNDVEVSNASDWIVASAKDATGNFYDNTGMRPYVRGKKGETALKIGFLERATKTLLSSTDFKIVIPANSFNNNSEMEVSGGKISLEITDGFKSISYPDGKSYVWFSANEADATESDIKLTYVITDEFTGAIRGTEASPEKTLIKDWFYVMDADGNEHTIDSLNITASGVIEREDDSDGALRNKLTVTFSTKKSNTSGTRKYAAVPGAYDVMFEIPSDYLTHKNVIKSSSAARFLITKKVNGDDYDERVVTAGNAKTVPLTPIVISGQEGLPIINGDVRITLDGDYVKDAISSESANALSGKVVINGLAEGLGYKLKESIPAGASSFIITIFGTPTVSDPQDSSETALRNAKRIDLSSDFLLSGVSYSIADKIEKDTVFDDNDNNRLSFDIKLSPRATVNAGGTNVSGMRVGTAVGASDKKKIRVSVAPTSTIKFKAKAKTDNGLDNWFVLPEGLHATLDKDIVANSTYFDAVITGTPSSATIEPIELKIPAKTYTIGIDSQDGTSKILAANDDVRWDIAGTARLAGKVTGTKDRAIKESTDEDGQVLIVTITGDKFKAPLSKGAVLCGYDDLTAADASLLVINPPDGVFTDDSEPYKIVSAQAIAAGDRNNVLKIRVSGTPKAGYAGLMSGFRIDGSLLESGKEINAEARSDNRFDIGPAAYVGDRAVKFTAGDSVVEPETKSITVHLVGVEFKEDSDGGPKAEDSVLSWFSDGGTALPEGFDAVVQSVDESRNSLVIDIKGIEKPAATDDPVIIRLRIAGSALSNGSEVITTDDDSITFEVTAPAVTTPH